MSTPARLDAAAMNETYARMRAWRALHPDEDQAPEPVHPLAVQAANMGSVHAADSARRLALAPRPPALTPADEWALAVPRRFRACDLDGLDSTPSRAKVADWATADGPRSNLVLSGPTGTGKTWAATAALHACYDLGYGRATKVAWWAVPDLLADMRPGGDERAYRRATLADVLLLDDLGAERLTDWAAEAMYRLVNRRYLDERATIVTTNLAVGPGEGLADAVGARIWSRLVGDDAVVVGFGGADRRTS